MFEDNGENEQAESNDEKVERFIDLNRRFIQTAMNLENQEDQGIHSKVLLCAIFDSSAKTVFPTVGNGERFKETVVQYTGWSDCERVSLLHLVRALEVVKPVPREFIPLQKWAITEFSTRFHVKDAESGFQWPISNDPESSEVELHWPQNKGTRIPLGYIRLEHLQHKNMLWLYRNSLVHEYRIPGYGSEWRLGSTAVYIHVSRMNLDTNLDIVRTYAEVSG